MNLIFRSILKSITPNFQTKNKPTGDETDGLKSFALDEATKALTNTAKIMKNSFEIKPLNQSIIPDDERLLLDRLQKLKVNPLEEIPPPPTILNMNGQPIFSINGTSTMTGKPKSRKSFFVSTAIAALLNGQYGVLTGYLPDETQKILLFDTEQEPYRVQRIMKRIENMIGQRNLENLEIYRLRGENTNDRLTLIDTALNYNKNLGAIFIDGIRDLLFDINSPEQATDLVNDTVLPWTDKYNVHICSILHQNKAKGNTDPRGHLGSELMNKSETVLSIAKDEKRPDISTVTPEQTRDKEPEPTAFYIDESVTPVIPVFDENYIVENASQAKAPKDPDSFLDSTHEYVLKETFKKLDKPKYGELQNTLLLEFKQAGQKLGVQKIKTFIQYYINEGYLKTDGKKPHKIYILNREKAPTNDKENTLF